MKTWLKVLTLTSFITFQSLAIAGERIDIWPSIPFLKGANLCNYSDAFGQSRREYMNTMVGHASELLGAGAIGSEALDLLVAFDALYDKNQRLATRGKYLDVTLESTLKSYLDGYYRKLRPREKKISFTHTNKLVDIITALKNDQRIGYINDSMINELDYIAYGSYSYAPDCRGKIVVTLHLIGKDGATTSYTGTGKPAYVMSQIASKIFEDFQRTKLPSRVKIGSGYLTIVGSLQGPIGTAYSPRDAEDACKIMDARLPNSRELEMISLYGDWSGGISIGRDVWALPYGKVFHPGLRNPSPVRNVSEVNAREFSYYCVK